MRQKFWWKCFNFEKKRRHSREYEKIRAKIISLDSFIKEYANHILSINRIFGWKFVEPLTIFWMTNRYGWNDETRRAAVYCLINVFMQRMSSDICNARNSKNWNSPVQRHCVCVCLLNILKYFAIQMDEPKSISIHKAHIYIVRSDKTFV